MGELRGQSGQWGQPRLAISEVPTAQGWRTKGRGRVCKAQEAQFTWLKVELQEELTPQRRGDCYLICYLKQRQSSKYSGFSPLLPSSLLSVPWTGWMLLKVSCQWRPGSRLQRSPPSTCHTQLSGWKVRNGYEVKLARDWHSTFIIPHSFWCTYLHTAFASSIQPRKTKRLLGFCIHTISRICRCYKFCPIMFRCSNSSQSGDKPVKLHTSNSPHTAHSRGILIYLTDHRP